MREHQEEINALETHEAPSLTRWECREVGENAKKLCENAEDFAKKSAACVGSIEQKSEFISIKS